MKQKDDPKVIRWIKEHPDGAFIVFVSVIATMHEVGYLVRSFKM